jgi:hypothetical protein
MVTPPLDRPWVLGGKADEVFLMAANIATANEAHGINSAPIGGIWVARSTDGGLTFPQQVLAASNADRISGYSGIAGDDEHLYFTYARKVADGRLDMILSKSSDAGRTWSENVFADQLFFPEQCFSPLTIFPAIAADGQGGVFVTWTLENPQTNRIDLFFAASRDHGVTWNKPMLLTDRAGTREIPWITADPGGRVGIVWYETNVTLLDKSSPDPTNLNCVDNAQPDTAWYIHYATSNDPLDASPTFAEGLVQGDPIHKGDLGRPYAEVLQVRFMADGRAATAYVADTPVGVARPIFAIESRTN